jgi:hypothetical protein
MESWTLIRLDLLLAVVALAIGFAVAISASGQLDALLCHVARWARCRSQAVLAVAVMAAAIAAGISGVRRPLPHITDEFSYLLAADTFAAGRLTNPPHAMGEHFETYHVIQQPTYASKYPPAQGMILALGKIVMGTPDLGLWLSMGLAAGSVCWMLQGWMPARWALFGGVLGALHANLQIHWSQTYWGGNLALSGGALILGAYPRLRRHACCRDATVMACGLAILANARPYEGLAASLPVAAAMLIWICQSRGPALRGILLHVGLPLATILTLTGVLMAYYNFRVTGDCLRMPYQVHEATYGYTPLFLWQSPGPVPEYRHEIMRVLYLDWVRETFEIQRSWSGFLAVKSDQLLRFWLFAVGIPLTIPLILAPRVFRDRRVRLALAMIAAVVAALLGTAWIWPHYAAPAVPAVLLLVIQAVRHVRAVRRRHRVTGRHMVRALIISQFLLFLLHAASYLVEPPHPFAKQRADLVAQLRATNTRHLVIVHYSQGHSVHDEWVYNDADIDAAPIVWARSMGPELDQRLLRYFADRQAWRLWPDRQPVRLRPLNAPRDLETSFED